MEIKSTLMLDGVPEIMIRQFLEFNKMINGKAVVVMSLQNIMSKALD